MAVGVFEDDCGLTVVQYVRMDGEMTLQRDLFERQTFVGHIPTAFHTRERTMSKQMLAMESIVMPLHYIIRG